MSSWLSRNFDRIACIAFVLYCIEAGVFLLWAPWTPFWERAVFGLPWPALGKILAHPVARGGVSGFGLVHLLWGLHDLVHLFRSKVTT